FFSSRRRHTRFSRDWSSDVCSSDLYYRTGGISTYIIRLIEALERLDSVNRYTVFHSRKARESLVTRFERAALWTPSHHRIERVRSEERRVGKASRHGDGRTYRKNAD